jgi:hypothetical protein
MEVTKEQIDAWKKQHGDIHELNVELRDGSRLVCYIKPMDRITYSAAAKLMKTDELEGAEVMLRNLHIGGENPAPLFEEKELMSLLAAANQLGKLLDIKDAQLKKV